ncbi:NAD-dependent epimerase/dehydratase family protein [Hellea sp.]|nr:NAD-dependent epimerase/dehydratase family protein [Hellea sp.]
MANSQLRAGLIGYTGFVGGQLMQQREFSHLYNSRSINKLAGQDLDLLVCAGAPAVMWAANKDSKGDWANLSTIVDAVSKARIKTLVLISSIAVFDDMAAGYTEGFAKFETVSAYGRNRRRLELELENYCERIVILRLPALFGSGLKKNFLFDIANPVPSYLTKDKHDYFISEATEAERAAAGTLFRWNDNLGMFAFDRTEAAQDGLGKLVEKAIIRGGMESVLFTNSESQFQFYNVARLWQDINTALLNNLHTVNFGSPPFRAADVHHALTGRPFENKGPKCIMQDIRSEFASIYQGNPPYMSDYASTMSDLIEFHLNNKS